MTEPIFGIFKMFLGCFETDFGYVTNDRRLMVSNQPHVSMSKILYLFRKWRIDAILDEQQK